MFAMATALTLAFLTLPATANWASNLGLPPLCGGWRKGRVDAMSKELGRRLFGQPMAGDVVEALREHVNNPNPVTPLSMSFHGDTGVGKTFVALDFIEKELRGRGSLFGNGVLTLHGGTITNRCHKDVKCAKQELSKKIKEVVSGCPTSLIVIDEVEDLEPMAIDAVASLLDNYDSVEGVDYRRCVFIFTSNMGIDAIKRVMFKHIDAGKPRSSLKHADFDQVIGRAAFTGAGGTNGFLNSQLLNKHRIDRFVVFLPLFKEHVRLCLGAALERYAEDHAHVVFRSLTWTDEVVEEMLKEQHFGKRGIAEAGCKRSKIPVSVFVIHSVYTNNKSSSSK